MSIQGNITGQGNISRLLQEGINAVAHDEYADYEPEYSKVLEVDDSEKAYEEDLALAGFGLAKLKPEGTGVEYDNEQQGWQTRYQHNVYALGTIITFEAIVNNLYKDMMVRAGKMLKRSLVHTEELVAANVFNRGYNASYPGGDSEPLFSENHRLIKGGTYSNRFSVFTDLSEAALEDAIIQIEDFRDDAGLLIDAKPMSLHIPRSLQFIARRILGSTLQNDTANNAINALKDGDYLPGGYHINHRFTDQKAWFVRTSVPDGGKFFRRMDHMFDQDNDFGTSNYRHKGLTYFSTGWTDPRQYFGSGPGA